MSSTHAAYAQLNTRRSWLLSPTRCPMYPMDSSRPARPAIAAEYAEGTGTMVGAPSSEKAVGG